MENKLILCYSVIVLCMLMEKCSGGHIVAISVHHVISLYFCLKQLFYLFVYMHINKHNVSVTGFDSKL